MDAAPRPGRRVVVAAASDVAWIVLFVVIGRSNHAEGLRLAGLARTAWPFLTGAAVGWLVAGAWRRPVAPVPTGVVVWLGTVVVGMALRVVAGQGTAVAFCAVALGFLGLGLLGWRLVVDRVSTARAGSPGTAR